MYLLFSASGYIVFSLPERVDQAWRENPERIVQADIPPTIIHCSDPGEMLTLVLHLSHEAVQASEMYVINLYSARIDISDSDD